MGVETMLTVDICGFVLFVCIRDPRKYLAGAKSLVLMGEVNFNGFRLQLGHHLAPSICLFPLCRETRRFRS